MRGKKALIITALMAAFTLAGCVDDADPPETPDAPVPTGPQALAELTCDFTYPDNETPLPCENQLPESTVAWTDQPGTATAAVEHQEPWICVEQLVEPEWGFSIHWDPVAERYGMYYHFDEVDRSLDAVLYSVDGPIGTALYDIEPEGFIVLPEIPNRGPPENLHVMNFSFYIHDYMTDTPELEGGDVRALWSFWEERAYPIHEITTDDGSYYFHNVSVEKGQAGSSIYKMQGFQMEGEDYNVTVQYSEQKALQIGWNPNPELCTLV